MVKRKTLVIIGVTLAAVVSIVLVGLWQTGYLLTDHRIVSGQSMVPMSWSSVQQHIQDQTLNNTTLLNLFFILMNETAHIPGIEKITFQVFYSNDSVSSVRDQYQSLMDQRGYVEQKGFSGSYSQYDQTVYYWTYTHGISGAVIFASAFLGKTWICYASGNALDLLHIYNYLISHGYIQ